MTDSEIAEGMNKRYIDEGDRIVIQMDVDVEKVYGDTIRINDHEDSFSNMTPMYFIDAQTNLYKIYKDDGGYYFVHYGDLPSL